MVATYISHTHDALPEDETWAWEAGETVCEGCGHRLAARAARIVSYGPVSPGGTASERPRVFHRLQCAAAYVEAQTLRLGLEDL